MGVRFEIFHSANLFLKTKISINISLTTEVITILCVFCSVFAKYWWPWQRPVIIHHQKMFQLDRLTSKNPLQVFMLSLSVFDLNSVITVYFPKLVTMVTPLCPLHMGCTSWVRWQQKSYLRTKPYVDISPRTAVITVFVWCSLGLKKFGYHGNNVLVRFADLENPLYKWSPCHYIWYESSIQLFLFPKLFSMVTSLCPLLMWVS